MWADGRRSPRAIPKPGPPWSKPSALLDSGAVRVAEVNGNGEVVVNQWLKQAILLLFSMAEMETMELGAV